MVASFHPCINHIPMVSYVHDSANSEYHMKQDFLEIFSLPPKSKRVLMDIIAHGVSSVAMISSRLNMPKSSIYDAVIPLLEQSLINEYSGDHGKTFGMSDSEQLTRAHKEKIEELQQAQASLLSFINMNHKDDDVAKPKIKFYAGNLGIKQAFRDIPWSPKYRETYLLWPVKEMIDIDEDFFRWHGQQRFKYGVVLKCIEKHSDRILQSKKHEWLQADKTENLNHVRYLPKGTDWKMSFWIYGNKCLFASGGAEKIAFTVHSKEFCEMMKLLWENLWEKAKE